MLSMRKPQLSPLSTTLIAAAFLSGIMIFQTIQTRTTNIPVPPTTTTVPQENDATVNGNCGLCQNANGVSVSCLKSTQKYSCTSPIYTCRSSCQ